MLIHVYMQRIYIYGRGYAALTPRTRPAFGRARLARASSQPAACAAHAHTHICNAYIYMVAATPRSLLERDPHTGGRDSLGPAANRLLAPPMVIHIYMQHIYMCGRGYAALTPNKRPAYGQARLATANSEPAACAAHAHTYIYETHIYIWSRLRRAHSSHATRLRAGATR